MIIQACGASQYLTVGYFVRAEHLDYGKHLLLNLDLLIPYTDLFIPAYIFMNAFPLCVFLLILFFGKENSNLTFVRQFICMLIFMQTVAFAIFYLYPTSMDALIASAGTPYNFFPNITHYYNSNVLPSFNSLPSLHIADSWLMVLVFFYFFPEDSKVKKCLEFSLVILFILIALSTVTLKYHYLMDVFTGMLLAEIAFVLIVLNNFCKVEKWESICGKKHLLFMEFLLALIMVSAIVLAYPNYMALGH